MTDKTQNLQQEWIAFHDNVEQSERFALLIKLLSVLIVLAAFISQLDSPVIVLLLLVLWLQEAIWKTFQGRAEQRLLVIEKALSDNENKSIPGFYSSWEQSRPGVIGLFTEYLSNAIRPTVAFPYAVLLLIVLLTRYTLLPG